MRTLRLARETLTELTTGELAAVVGGVSGLTCPDRLCGTNTSNYEDCFTYSCWTGSGPVTG
jgi:hypothetical protein